ncbi:MAG: hypothetical protein H6R18_25 [Proteobacteria bacterium]|nr:hypothetical protein [Pseudomonadota bacterium]
MNIRQSPSVIVIGAGPAGLMAAQTLLAGGVEVDVYDSMPSIGRKFLMAGKGGLNITHSEAHADFLRRYGQHRAVLQPMLDAFTANAVRDWMQGLGIDSFVGSSGRVFPAEMKAAPLLRAWQKRLRQNSCHFHIRHRWLGWNEAGDHRFATPTGEISVKADATLLALGGGSWPQLGSDGAWVSLLAERGIAVAPLKPANCGFDVGWSTFFTERFAGQPVKPVTLTFSDHHQRGEFLITQKGVEGGLIYTYAARLRDEIAANGSATIYLDLLPDHDAGRVADEIARPRGSRSLSTHLQSRLGLKGVKSALLHELLAKEVFADPAQLAAAVKSLPLRLIATRPLAEAISSAGGIEFSDLDENLMLKNQPGNFCAGEMLDWEAPTGGYLITACLATGRAAGLGTMNWLEKQSC